MCVQLLRDFLYEKYIFLNKKRPSERTNYFSKVHSNKQPTTSKNNVKSVGICRFIILIDLINFHFVFFRFSKTNIIHFSFGSGVLRLSVQSDLPISFSIENISTKSEQNVEITIFTSFRVKMSFHQSQFQMRF